jgi:hypothetical protein
MTEAILPLHIVGIELSLNRIPDDAIHVSGFVPPKRQLTFNGLHGVISQKIGLFEVRNASKIVFPRPEWKRSLV